MIDTGEISDPDILGGRLGFMSFSQEKVIWSAVSARCLGEYERFPLALPPTSFPLLFRLLSTLPFLATKA